MIHQSMHESSEQNIAAGIVQIVASFNGLISVASCACYSSSWAVYRTSEDSHRPCNTGSVGQASACTASASSLASPPAQGNEVPTRAVDAMQIIVSRQAPMVLTWMRTWLRSPSRAARASHFRFTHFRWPLHSGRSIHSPLQRQCSGTDASTALASLAAGPSALALPEIPVHGYRRLGPFDSGTAELCRCDRGFRPERQPNSCASMLLAPDSLCKMATRRCGNPRDGIHSSCSGRRREHR